MQVPKFSISRLLLKLAVFVSIFYVAILAISILITGYLFVSLDSYKARIEGVVFKHTGYKLTVESIQTKLNSYYLPEVIITNAKLTNPSDTKQSFGVKSIELVFSYSSIWHLEPIFDQININGTNINIELLADGSVLFNGININHPDKQTIENTKNGPIDLENWLLKQKSIKLVNINFSFNDKSHNLPIVYLNNITTTLTNSGKNHNFVISLDTPGESGSSIIGKLNWVGGKVTEYEKWKSAEFKLQSYTGKDKVSGMLNRYIPELTFLKEFNAETALDGAVKNGKLQYFYANFDLQNLQYAMKHNNGIVNLPQLGGSIKIELIDNTYYKLDATNLTISTSDGYVLNDKSIKGVYNIGKNGQISVESTDLKAFNNLLPLLPSAKGISFSGTIEIVKFNWLGEIFKPASYEIFAKFHDLAINSKNPNIPSINGINGDLSIFKDHGTLNLLLKDSTLNYNSIFLIPYKFKHLDTQITWQTKPQNKTKTESSTLVVNLGKTNVQTPDFSGTAYGWYSYTPGTSGYLYLQAHVDKVLTSKVGDYLPVQIGDSVHKWLKDGLVGGYGTNASLDLQGPLDDFPFQDGGGRFYIDADIQDAKLLYVKDWPTLDNLYGKFKIRNQAIIIEAKSGKVYGNDINKALVTIPDMTATGAYLVADGLASGSTTKFMQYLQKTPINEIIGHIPDKVTTTGQGEVTLHLKVPFDKPEKTEVDGNYNFINNGILFDLPVPELSSVNGKLYFTDHGVKIDKITAIALDSEAILMANTDKNGVMHFSINSSNLNYKGLSEFYMTLFSSIIDGRANTQIGFDIGKNGISDITAKSNLIGVNIDAPQPIAKESQELGKLNFAMLNSSPGFKVNFNYSDVLNGKVTLDQHGQLAGTNISLGSVDYLNNTSNNPKIMINAKLENTYALDWLDTITQITSSNKNNKQSSESNTYKTHVKKEIPEESDTNIYPIELWLDTPHLYFGKTDYKRSSLDILVTKENAIFALNNMHTNGYGYYNFDKNQLDIIANDFHFYQSVSNILHNDINESQVPFAATINNYLASNTSFNNITSAKQNFNKLKSESTSANDPNVKIPLTHILINQFWFENQPLGKFMVTLRPNGKDLIIESGILQGKTSKVSFNGVNYCMECGSSKAFVDMQTQWDINDLGILLGHIGHENTIAGGKGSVTASIQWNGRLDQFDITHSIATINMNIKDGKFLKIDTTSGILAQIIGIMNLQYLYSFVNLSFGQVISNGFFFNQLKMTAYLINNKIDIQNLYIWGATATINSSGVIDLQHETINMKMSVAPHLSTTVAVGVGVATLNPIIGLATYGAELLLDSPVNKLFTFTFKITGSLYKPDIEQIGVTKQVVKNVNSTIQKGGT